jgi:hypothetical protein
MFVYIDKYGKLKKPCFVRTVLYSPTMGHFFISIFPSAIGTILKHCEIQLGTYIGGEI